jgi:transcription antitermination factor NusG
MRETPILSYVAIRNRRSLHAVSTGGTSSKENLFPGYVFAFFDHDQQWLNVMEVRQVVRILEPGLSEREMEAIRQLATAPVPVLQHTRYVSQGERIKVLYGPLQGLEGVVERPKGKCRLVISIESIGISKVVEVDEAQVVAIAATAGSTGTGLRLAA